MSLTVNDKKHIQESWHKVSSIGLQDVGLIIFVRLFTDHPDTILLFKNVVPSDIRVTVENLKSHPSMAAHALSVARGIGKIVSLLDSPTKLNDELATIAGIHEDKSIKSAEFESLGQVLINVLRETLKCNAEDDVINAWSKAYGVIQTGVLGKMSQKQN